MCARRFAQRCRVISIASLFVIFSSLFGNCFAESEFAPGEEFVEDVMLKGLPISTVIAFAPGNKAYLAQKVGTIRVLEGGSLLPTPFIDLSAEVNKATDRGLLGLAVDPDFPRKPFIYVSYVYDPPGSTPDSSDPRVIRIARIEADAASNYNVALPKAPEVLVGKNSTAENMAPPVPIGDPNIPERASCMTGLTMDGTPIEDCIASDAPSHAAGTLKFGSNRELFASFGDGADYDGPTRVGLRVQNLDSLSGRILRFNADTGDGIEDNPWFDPTHPQSNRSRTWAYGFRNPFRITLHPTNKDVYIGDVGTSYYEEVNAGKGMNFGWPCYEGGFTERSQLEGEATASTEQVGYRSDPRTIDFCQQMYALGQNYVRKPLFTYRHPYDENKRDLGASITGLAFYTGSTYPDRFKGSLFFADYAQKFIRYLTFDPNGHPIAHDFAKEIDSNLGAVELLSGPDNTIYAVYIDLKSRTSEVRRFRPISGGNKPPVVRASVSPLTGDTPLVVNASASTSYDPEGQALSFSWDFGDGETSSEADTTHVYTRSGTYTVRITVTEKSSPYTSSSDSYTVRSGARTSSLRITSPQSGSQFEIGKPITLSGEYSDPSQAPAQLRWAILQIHNQHTHLVNEIEGATSSFTPVEHADNVAYQMCLEAYVQDTLSDQQCVTVNPRTSPRIFASDPSGATITYLDEELDVVTPYIAHPVVGSKQSIRAQPIYAGRSFLKWQDGETAVTRDFTTTAEVKTFTAIYANRAPSASVTVAATTSRRRRRRSATFSGTSSKDPEGERLTCRWRFSDRTRYSGELVTKTFSRDGTYWVELSVSDPFGGSSRIRKKIVVSSRRGIRILQ